MKNAEEITMNLDRIEDAANGFSNLMEDGDLDHLEEALDEVEGGVLDARQAIEEARGKDTVTHHYLTKSPLREAVILGGLNADLESVRDYLPSNYEIRLADSNGPLVIYGKDVAGWTLDGYVIPRLLSGLIVARELAPS